MIIDWFFYSRKKPQHGVRIMRSDRGYWVCMETRRHGVMVGKVRRKIGIKNG